MLYRKFEAFLQKEYDVDNLYFYVEVLKLEELPEDDDEKIAEQARAIGAQYLGLSGKEQTIHLKPQQIAYFTEALNRKKVSQFLFHDACDEVEAILKTKYIAFVSDDAY